MSATATIVLIAALKLNYLTHPAWHILLAGFEAATVGGIADWFAVRALFREIPIPFIRRHTNIIVKSRKKLSAGIVDLVSTQWLSKESISSKIADISISNKLLDILKDDKVQQGKLTL
ncbi:MAG: DUF445 family protein [Flavobacteriaceae bacterium]|nr:DUF445 family protein [Flavobacteriaceae bacterium]